MRHAVIDLRRASVGNGHRLLVEESQSILVGKRSFLQSLIENAIAAPEHGLAIDAVSEPDSWTKCFMVGVLWTLSSITPCPRPEVGVSSQDVSGSRILERWINRGKAIECFGSGQIEIITQAVVQCEARAKIGRALTIARIVIVANSAESTVVPCCVM